MFTSPGTSWGLLTWCAVDNRSLVSQRGHIDYLSAAHTGAEPGGQQRSMARWGMCLRNKVYCYGSFHLCTIRERRPFRWLQTRPGEPFSFTRERGVSLWCRTTHILHRYTQWPQTNLRNPVPRADRNSLVFQEWRKVSLILTRLNDQRPPSL